jgi:hypothetical protein
LSRSTHERLDSEFTEEAFMPLIQARVIDGVFTEAQKRQIIHKVTDTGKETRRL